MEKYSQSSIFYKFYKFHTGNLCSLVVLILTTFSTVLQYYATTRAKCEGDLQTTMTNLFCGAVIIYNFLEAIPFTAIPWNNRRSGPKKLVKFIIEIILTAAALLIIIATTIALHRTRKPLKDYDWVFQAGFYYDIMLLFLSLYLVCNLFKQGYDGDNQDVDKQLAEIDRKIEFEIAAAEQKKFGEGRVEGKVDGLQEGMLLGMIEGLIEGIKLGREQGKIAAKREEKLKWLAAFS